MSTLSLMDNSKILQKGRKFLIIYSIPESTKLFGKHKNKAILFKKFDTCF
jgi:hypothetical protein